MPPYESTMIFRPVTPQSADGPAFDELPGGIDEDLDVRAEPRAEHFREETARDVVADLVVRRVLGVLRRDEHRLDTHRADCVRSER